MKVDIYLRPQETPGMIIEDTAIRIYYAGQWVDFRDGRVVVVDDFKKKASK